MKLILEMFLWTVEKEMSVRYHLLQADITDSLRDPDAIMKDQLLQFGIFKGKGARYAHSTSWRYESGRTLLSYLIWVDQWVLLNLPSNQLRLPMVTCPSSRGPLKPRPDAIHETHVLFHGLRHLRYLVFDQKNNMAGKICESQETHALLKALKPAPSGRLSVQPIAVDNHPKGAVGSPLKSSDRLTETFINGSRQLSS